MPPLARLLSRNQYAPRHHASKFAPSRLEVKETVPAKTKVRLAAANLTQF